MEMPGGRSEIIGVGKNNLLRGIDMDCRHVRKLVPILIALLLLSGCGSMSWRSGGVTGGKPYTVRGKTYYPLQSARGFVEEGTASWYGPGFHGKRTANGETFDMRAMTAAHKILPLGTMVRVTNKNNGRSLVLRINDRGPFVHDRVIDLSRGAAEKLDVVAKGTAPVRIVALK
jgi:rare lipoprotein A